MKRKKKLSLSLSLALVAASVFIPQIQSYASQIGVTINGSAVQFNASTGSPFVDSSNRTQVPLRATMEAYGCDVDWDRNTRTAIVQKDGKTVKVPIGSNNISINGYQVENDTVAVIKDNRTYLPIRAVLEAFGGYVSWNQAAQSVSVDNTFPLLKIHFIDVGQADAALIDIGNTEVLIDGGNNANGQQVVNYLRPYVDGALDYVIATHTDADHIGGLDDVLAAYQVDTVIGSGDTSSTSTYRDYWAAVQSEPNSQYMDDSDMVLPLEGGAELEIIETGDNNGDTNGNSVIAQLNYGKVKVLFTGDIDSDVESQNLDKFEDVDVLKVAHHGSKTSTSSSFLSVIHPEYAVISAGSNNTYGHPSADTLSRLSAVGCKTLGTFKSGTVSLSSNGKVYNLNKSNYLTIADAGAGTGGSTLVTPPGGNTPTNPSGGGTTVNPQPQTPVTTSYIGNKNSKIFHKSTCSSVKRMSASNKVPLSSVSAALSTGYKPCKICNPA